MPADGWLSCICKITRDKRGQGGVGRYFDHLPMFNFTLFSFDSFALSLLHDELLFLKLLSTTSTINSFTNCCGSP
jgi:hypothetical protein